MDLPEAERERFVQERCKDDAALRRAVMDLLARESVAGSPLVSPFEGVAADVLEQRRSTMASGARVGDYRIERVLASGGMGVVYEAWQESPRRRVALKVLKSWLSTPSDVSRFRFEIEVLARLQHPGIAQVYESGALEQQTPKGLRQVPFFALEFVEGGRDLLEHVRSRDSQMRERLELFVQVCDAVHHGHQRGIVHRDLKPGNLLVTPEGRVKVIDFGVARAVEKEMDLRTRRTESGQLVGTLFYMSPEQFGLDPNAVDTRSDVWSLGVVLFELLSGQLPFDVESRPVHDVARIVTEAPARRLRSLSRGMPVEADWILQKALEKDPARRYASAAELAADVRRLLSHEPVLARRPRLSRRAVLALRRNPLATLVAGVALLSLAASAVWYFVSLAESRGAERRQLYSAMLSSAASALAQGDMIKARRALLAAPGELRAWEWRHLQALIDESLEVVGDVQCGPVVRPVHGTITWSVAGQLLERGTGADDLPRSLGRLEGNISRLAWSPDGQYLAVAEWDGHLRLFECTDDLHLVTELALWDIPHSVEFSPCGERVAVAMEESHVLVFDNLLQRILHDLKGLRGVVHNAHFVLDEEHLLTKSTDGRARIWYLRENRSRDVAEGTDPVGDVAVAPDRRHAVVVHATGAVGVLDLARPGSAATWIWSRQVPTAYRAAFDPTGRWLAVCDSRAILRILDTWEVEGDVLLRGHERVVSDLAWSADSRFVFTGGSDGRLLAWEPSRGSAERAERAHVGDVACVRFSPDSLRIVSTARRYGELSTWDGNNPRLRRTSFVGQHSAGHVSFSPTARWMATVDGIAQVLDAESLEAVWRVPSEERHDTAVAWDPRDEALIVAGETGRVERWRVGSDAPERTRAFPEARFSRMRLDAPTDRLVLGTADGELLLLRASDLELLARTRAHAASVSGLAVAPDGGRAYSTSLDACLKAWSLPSLALEAEVKVDSAIGDDATDGINDLALSPDGTRMALATRSSYVRIFDSRSLEEMLTLSGGGGWVTTVDFSPDGRTLAAGTSDGRLVVWNDRSIREARPVLDSRPRATWSRDGLRSWAQARLCDRSTHEPELTRASEVARALRWTDRIDPRIDLCAGLAALRNGLLERALLRGEHATLGLRGTEDPCYRTSRALCAVALARLSRQAAARAALEEALAGPPADRDTSALIEEALAELGPARGEAPPGR